MQSMFEDGRLLLWYRILNMGNAVVFDNVQSCVWCIHCIKRWINSISKMLEVVKLCVFLCLATTADLTEGKFCLEHC